MRENDSLISKLQPEETLPVEDPFQKHPEEPDAEIVPDPESRPQNEAPEGATESTEPPETSIESIPVENEPTEDGSTAEANTPDTAESSALPYHERYYLKYRGGKRSTPLDLDGTSAFLQALGFDGGELRQAREGKNCAENYRNADNNKNTQMYCSYCGAQIAGVEFFRLPDGRMRCTTCSKTVVKTKAEVEALCKRVITNFDTFFGATIDVPVSIEVVEHRKLKNKVGVPSGAKENQSLMILGVAVNKKQKYSIILENGAPRISLIATFAHELTHIWQYTHWDNNKNLKKCPKSKRLLIYEGMAKWVEIQYLYLIGETNVAKREEYITRNREDEYGIGFRLYDDQYPLSRGAMSCEDTPFTPDRYPLN